MINIIQIKVLYGFVQPLDWEFASLPIVQKFPGLITDTMRDFVYSTELFDGMWGLDIAAVDTNPLLCFTFI